VDIVISGDRIQSLEPHRSGVAPRSATRVIDAFDMTAIPGLSESHTHEWIRGKFYGDRLGAMCWHMV